MGFDKAVEQSEDATDADKQNARDGRQMMNEQAANANTIISPETADDSSASASASASGGRAGSGVGASLSQVMTGQKDNIKVVNKVISQGGFLGADKDKFDISQAHSEWIKSRNEVMNCPKNIINTSIQYTALIDGRASQGEIVNANQVRVKTKDTCDKSPDVLINAATKYVEIDRRVRENRIKDQNTYPIEGFAIEDIKEGFIWYRDKPKTIPLQNLKNTNQRLPLYEEKGTTGNGDGGVLKWEDYYTNCSIQDVGERSNCDASMKRKSTYIQAINNLFYEADTLINVLYNLNKSGNTGSGKQTSADRNKLLQKIVNKQASDIDIFKQEALYNYDEYNGLMVFDDAFMFVYYALFIIFAVLSLRDFASSPYNYDKRNIIIVILLGIYPKYIVSFVIWCLNGLTMISQMLGLKNVYFWK